MKFTLNIEGSAEELRDALVTLDRVPEKTAEKRPAPASAPKPAPSLDDVRKAMMKAIDAGKRQQCSETLAEYGARRVTDLPEDARAEFLAKIEAL